MNARSHRITFSTRHSPAVNDLFLRQVAEGLVEGPFPGRVQPLAQAVFFALRQWPLHRTPDR